MPKGRKNKKYAGEFKQMVVETMRKENMGYHEAARQFGVPSHSMVAKWERIYLEEDRMGCISIVAEEPAQPPEQGKGVHLNLIKR